MFDPILAKRIVDLRESGLTWHQIDEMIFPAYVRKKKCDSAAGAFAQKHRKKNPELEGAFTKTVIGYGTKHQTVIKLRDRIVPMQKPVAQQVEMFI